MPRVWSINGRFLTQPFSGVQRYAYEIIRELDNLVEQRHELARDLVLELLVPPNAKGRLPLTSIPARQVGYAGGHVWEQSMLPGVVRGGLLSLCNSGPVAVSKQIVCLHDLNTRICPESYSFAFRTLYRVLGPALGHRASRVATVSHYSASQLVQYGVVGKEKLRVIPNGYEHAGRWRAQHSEKTRSAAGPNTVVLLGSPAPHKNIAVLLGLADDLGKAGLRLAIAGLSDSRVFQHAPPQSSAENVIWLGRLSDGEIAALLSDCLCLAFPSFVEGFGLPAVEAMAWNCPVVSSDRASLPEICGDAVLYAPPDNPAAWLEQILKLAGDAALRDQLIEKGRAQMQKFSWRRSAELYLQVMAEVDGLASSDRIAA